jgi:hypothetical protein
MFVSWVVDVTVWDDLLGLCDQKKFIPTCAQFFMVMEYDSLKCRIKFRITDKIWNKIKQKKTHYLIVLGGKFNLTSWNYLSCTLMCA